MRRRFTKSVDARRRARKAARKTIIKTGTKVIPDKRRKPEKHKVFDSDFGGPDYD